MEDIPFSGNHFLLAVAISLMEAISFQWKPFPLVEALRFSGNCFLSFQWKPFLLEETIGLYWKQFLLVETAPFNR